MSNIFKQLSPEDFKNAWCGCDGVQSPYRFLVHEFPVEDVYPCYRISVSQYFNGELAALEHQFMIEPSCLIPIEEQRRRGVEWCIRELQKFRAHQDGQTMRLEDMATINNLPDFDCRFTSRYEIQVAP